MTKHLSQKEDQTFWIQVKNTIFSVRLYDFRGMLYVDISSNGEKIVSGKRVLPNAWIVPEGIGSRSGNVRIESRTADVNEYPTYDGLNDKFVFSYYTAEEIDDMSER